MRKRVKIYDGCFAHAKYTTDFQESKYIVWDREMEDTNDDPIFYTDSLFNRVSGEVNNKYAMLLEPPSLAPGNYEYLKENNHLFNKVLTYNKDMLDLGDKYVFYPYGGCWIEPEEQKIYNKSRLCSIVASGKRDTVGHRLRHEVISHLGGSIDLYGRGYNPIANKISALQEYMFSITIENTKMDYYFTEKLIDCFRTGTVPIFYGCPSIGDFFDVDGMVIVDNLEDITYVMGQINTSFYESKKDNIKSNFEEAYKYIIAEDWIYENTDILCDKI